MTGKPIYHREESVSQTPEVAQQQIASQEIWGGPARNCFFSDIPKVKAYAYQLNRAANQRGIEFHTDVPPDRGTRPGLIYWSGERVGICIEDGYAKIKVKITFCNQLDEVYIAND